jgi:hypothetical protein
VVFDFETNVLRFNEHYLAFTPNLGTEADPETTYNECQMKFWVIVFLGSRTKYSHLFSQLMNPVTNLALLSLQNRDYSAFGLLEGLILLCTWNITSGYFLSGSVSYILCSAIFHRAQQTGLDPHCSMFHLTHTHSMVPRLTANLWALAVSVYQK